MTKTYGTFQNSMYSSAGHYHWIPISQQILHFIWIMPLPSLWTFLQSKQMKHFRGRLRMMSSKQLALDWIINWSHCVQNTIFPRSIQQIENRLYSWMIRFHSINMWKFWSWSWIVSISTTLLFAFLCSFLISWTGRLNKAICRLVFGHCYLPCFCV